MINLNQLASLPLLLVGRFWWHSYHSYRKKSEQKWVGLPIVLSMLRYKFLKASIIDPRPDPSIQIVLENQHHRRSGQPMGPWIHMVQVPEWTSQEWTNNSFVSFGLWGCSTSDFKGPWFYKRCNYQSSMLMRIATRTPVRFGGKRASAGAGGWLWRWRARKSLTKTPQKRKKSDLCGSGSSSKKSGVSCVSAWQDEVFVF